MGGWSAIAVAVLAILESAGTEPLVTPPLFPPAPPESVSAQTMTADSASAPLMYVQPTPAKGRIRTLFATWRAKLKGRREPMRIETEIAFAPAARLLPPVPAIEEDTKPFRLTTYQRRDFELEAGATPGASGAPPNAASLPALTPPRDCVSNLPALEYIGQIPRAP